MQRAVVGLDQTFEFVQQDGHLAAGLPIDRLLIELQPRGFHEKDLQVRQQQLDVSQPLLLHLTLDRPDQLGDLFVVRRHESDRRDAVDVVEQDAVAADFLVVGLDAEEVRVELQAAATHGRFGNEPDRLIGDKEEQRAGLEPVTTQVGPESPLPFLDPVNRKIVEPPGPREIVARRQRLDLEGDVAVARVVKLKRRVRHRSIPPGLCSVVFWKG